MGFCFWANFPAISFYVSADLAISGIIYCCQSSLHHGNHGNTIIVPCVFLLPISWSLRHRITRIPGTLSKTLCLLSHLRLDLLILSGSNVIPPWLYSFIPFMFLIHYAVIVKLALSFLFKDRQFCGLGWSFNIRGTVGITRGREVRIDRSKMQEPTGPSRQPIRACYLGHVTGYQQIRDCYFLVRSVPDKRTVILLWRGWNSREV